MAPPHKTRKTTTTSQTTSRRGGCGLDESRVERRAGEEEVADDHDEMDLTTAASLDAEMEDGTVSTAPEHSQSRSQSQAPDAKLQQLMVSMVDAQRARHRIRKDNVLKDYNSAHTKVQQDINGYFDDHETEASEAYKIQMARLNQLLRMKSEIEASMASKLDEMRKDYIFHSNAVESVVGYHMKQL